jgi:LacI family transcriptional regulator
VSEPAPDGIPRARPPTLADLAREARTSASTASRALSGPGYVSAEARARLLAAADRLGYVPNASARTLKQRTSRVVGVVVSDLGNQFYARLAAGVEQTLRDADYQVMLLGDNSKGEEELAGARTFLAMRAPGVIMTPVGSEATTLLAAHGVAVVEVDRQLATTPCDAVVIDNEGGARDATAHLLGLGHRRVVLLVARTDWTSDVGRLRGYSDAHAARLVCGQRPRDEMASAAGARA